MTSGQQVKIVNHPSLPGRTFFGVIVRKAGAGFRVRYECFGAMMTETFYPRALEAI
jgi:hypothetical protein